MNILLYVGNFAHEYRKNMKKNITSFLLILVLFALLVCLVACNVTPVTPPATDDPDDGGDTPAPVTFTVTFDSKGGTGIEGYKDVEFGQTVPAPTTNPTKEGYEFDCWTLSNGDKVDFDTYTVYSNVTFFASWRAKSYNLTAYLTDEKVKDNILDLSSGSVADHYGNQVSMLDGAKYDLRDTEVDGVTVKTLTFSLSYESTSASGQTLPVPTTTKDGDRFMFWYYYEGDTIVPLTKTLAKGSTSKTIDLVTGYKYDGARTLYAMWYSALENVTIKYNSGIEGESISTPDTTIKVGDYLPAPENPTISGYDFEKWTYIIKDDEGNDVVVDMDFYVDMAHQGIQITSDLCTDGVFNLTAVWTKRIEITSAEDFKALDQTDESVQNANIYLMNDVNLGEWTALFDHDNSFKGVFDGGGHTVTFTSSSNENSIVSLFGVNDGTVKSLLVSVAITITGNEDVDTYYVSGVAGVSTGTISAVEVRYFNADVSAGTSNVYVGSVVAYNDGSEVSGSKATNVTISASGYEVYAGGVVGLNNSGILFDIALDSTGTAVTIDLDCSYRAYAGGFAGKISTGSFVECSLTSANITAKATNTSYAGGVAGKIVNNILEKISLSNATISAEGRSAYAGGVVGEGGSTIRHAATTSVNVIATGTTAVAGGMVGANYCESGTRGQIQYSIARGTVTATTDTGKAYAGGICGQQNAGASSSNGAVAYVYAECNVTVNSDGEAHIGKAFGVYDTKTVCANVFTSTDATLTLNGVTHSDDNNFDVTTRADVEDVTPGQTTTQNASWINSKLRLNATASSSDPIWIVTDGAYPTLAFTA